MIIILTPRFIIQFVIPDDNHIDINFIIVAKNIFRSSGAGGGVSDLFRNTPLHPKHQRPQPQQDIGAGNNIANKSLSVDEEGQKWWRGDGEVQFVSSTTDRKSGYDINLQNALVDLLRNIDDFRRDDVSRDDDWGLTQSWILMRWKSLRFVMMKWW